MFTQGPGCGIVIINPVSLLLWLVPGTINFFLSHPSVYLKVFILLSPVVLYNSLCPKRIRPRRFGLPKANSSLFEPVTLVYLGRHHGKSVVTCMLVLSGSV